MEFQVKQEFAVPNSSQQIGVAERLLAEEKLPKMFWVRAMSTAVRVRNLRPTSSNEKLLSPTEKPTMGNHQK